MDDFHAFIEFWIDGFVLRDMPVRGMTDNFCCTVKIVIPMERRGELEEIINEHPQLRRLDSKKIEGQLDSLAFRDIQYVEIWY